ncbi:MAG: hypothetical protein PHE55_01330 [Methylococcaceae bacterium]|nr:hypothetical protein [Methylococcaceae bacterium]
MPIEIQITSTEVTGTAVGIAKTCSPGPATVVKGIMAFSLVHPLGLLSLVGAGLALLGIYDAVNAYREKKEISLPVLPTFDEPEDIEDIW